LDAFEGPLDLLLFLIKRDEVNIFDIPMARIAEQYMGFLSEIDRVDIEAAGEFLVTAATLLEIKSRMLMPRPEGAEGAASAAEAVGPSVDPRAELVRQLLAYKVYRDAASALEKRAEEWRLRTPAAAVDAVEPALDDVRFAREAEDGDGAGEGDDAAMAEEGAREGGGLGGDGELRVEDLSLVDLVEAFVRVSETVNFERLGTHNVTYDDTPIELHAEDILDRIARDGAGEAKEVEFATIFKARTRAEMVGLFLALLDLCRRRRVAFRHDSGGEIRLRARTAEELASDAAAVGAPENPTPTTSDGGRAGGE
jgi:segregation and condensation protein A